MKRLTAVVVSMMLGAFALPAIAQNMHKHGMAQQGATKSVTGEVVDMGCYLGHAARGEKHISCATKCLSQGMPMGILTANGMLYLVTLDHDNADPYNNLKDMAGKNATVTGQVLTRNGMKGIEATNVKLASK